MLATWILPDPLATMFYIIKYTSEIICTLKEKIATYSKNFNFITTGRSNFIINTIYSSNTWLEFYDIEEIPLNLRYFIISC